MPEAQPEAVGRIPQPTFPSGVTPGNGHEGAPGCTGAGLSQRWYARISAGRGKSLLFYGNAIECRITAEDADADFRPHTGVVERYLPPGGPGVRVDSHLYAGYEVPSHYDSLLAKLIVWAEAREAAIARMQRALGEYIIEGITTTIPFHKRLLRHEGFLRGETYTGFLQEEAASLGI